ncbi:MAG TPA: DUF4373 domain-containing protein [Anaerohalosphaeraceae bacterium]|nr:DUF4373 domain-containing protein [Anaerohalosphaeraceae bacterium]
MARPKKTALTYFPHDVNASSDDKIEAMRHLFGNDGYAFYFITLERIYASANHELCLADKLMKELFAKRIDVDLGRLDKMIDDSCTIGLFDRVEWEQSKVLTSKRIKETFDRVRGERKRKQKAYRKNSGKTPEKPRRNPTNKTKENETKEKYLYPDPQPWIDAISQQFSGLSARETEILAGKILSIQEFCRASKSDIETEMEHVLDLARQCSASAAENKKGAFISMLNDRYGLKKGPAEKGTLFDTQGQSDTAPDQDKKPFVKPTPDEVMAYAKSIGREIDAEDFCDFYEGKGWKVGTSPMVSWTAAVRRWKTLPAASTEKKLNRIGKAVKIGRYKTIAAG